MSVIITNDPHLIEFLDQFVEANLDFSLDEYDDWYCIQIKPFKCVNCKELICYATTGPHYIIIWPERDDNDMLQLADLLMKDGNYDPHIIHYNRIFGPCISWEQGMAIGWIENE
jgi:hypothetical protein